MPLDAVAVSCGPGSYTGLRIGVSMAKGICYGRNLPLIGLPTLKVQCVPVLLYHEELPEDALLCPMIDARRMEVYAAVYDRALKPVRDIAADIVDENSYRQGKDCTSQCTFHRRYPSAGKHDVSAGRKGNSRRGLQGRRLFRTILFERVRGKPTEKTYLVMGV